ncbi:MAG: hypothetical protein AVDCRST_MAG88-341 [uncultured Thermomicrobiales bacterium]|uniref:Pyrroloquinoline quinone-dependent pyranose dehydrogenase beta-propeller domain-containing protein n=1 Tax=uncultured Thermomicrobiales bacterium TaxID=1645740 RepID=A0A6J4UB08_9BACT|nr:MAG: hypothetical protein AVDCRST_MAG88-341 [uncultured Thermomicrobiales bacterium]
MHSTRTGRHHFLARAVLLLALAAPLLWSAPAQAGEAGKAEEVFFPETGLSLSDEHKFLSYWREHGGLAQFGYPRTPEIQEVNPADGKIYTVQWFERNRFEWHPEHRGGPYEVLLGLLGNQLALGREGEAPFQRVADPRLPGQTYFPETGHSLRNSFKAYWEANGGLPLYGYPISEEFEERDPSSGGTFVVQYFERNRFEWHPEHRGTRYEVLLGLLGNRIVGDPGAPDAPVASVTTPLIVPPQFRVGPFARERAMVLPPGFRMSVFAGGLPGARFMAVAPNGDLFVTRKDEGKVLVLPDRDRDGVTDSVAEWSRDVPKPHGLAFHAGFLYVATEASVLRYPYRTGDLAARGPAETVVPDLPSGPGSGLAGGVNHDTRTIVFGPDGAMYVSVGSSCDSCIEREERRATVLRFNPDGSGGRVFTAGLRNAVGLGFDPRTGLLWATVNERNALGPDRPPDFFVPLRDGFDYGWPLCLAAPSPEGPRADPILGAGRDEECRARVRPVPVTIRAHSAPLGMRFTPLAGAGRLPAPFANGVFMALHGPFSPAPTYGHRIVFLSLVPGRMQAGARDFAAGWVRPDGGGKWGSPVDIIFGADGAIYISDDVAGAVYRVTYDGP